LIESVNTNKMNTSYINMIILKIDIKLPSGKPLIYFLVLFLLFHKKCTKKYEPIWHLFFVGILLVVELRPCSTTVVPCNRPCGYQ